MSTAGAKLPSFRDEVKKILTSNEQKQAIYSFDVLGSMALLEIPDALKKKRKKIAHALLETNPRLTGVYEKVGTHSGKYRIEKIRWIVGKKDSIVEHKEWGCVFRVHPGKVFFNPRLATERHRIASLIRKNQTVAVFFSGAGPYAIVIAKHCKPKRVYALEWNPSAKPFLEQNLRFNKVDFLVIPVWGDVAKIHPLERCDHVVMPAPDTALSQLRSAVNWCKAGGIIHVYLFVSGSNLEEEAERLIYNAMKPLRIPWKIEYTHKVSDYSPRKQQWCIGLRIGKMKKARAFKKAKKIRSA
jgi:tRNA (guanine37-N1)-methyltransferase